MRRINRFGTRLLPREKGVPYTLAEILQKQVNAEDEAIIETVSIPPFTPQPKTKWSAAVKYVFFRGIKIMTP